MPTFSYKAKSPEDQIITGSLDAPTQDIALEALHSKNMVVLSLEEVHRGSFSEDIMAPFNRPKNRDLVIFTRQLATLISADTPLVNGLKILEKQTENPQFAKIIAEVRASIEGGSSLSSGLDLHPELFSQFYVSLVRSGEVAGKMDSTLLYLADYLEGIASLNSKIKSALSYPIFVLGAMVVVSVLMVTLVLPNLLAILKEAGVKDLPFTTKILIGVTDFVNGNIIILSIAFIGLLYFVFSYFHTAAGREKWDRIKIEFPGFGAIVRNLYISRFAETLGTLIRSGVPILQGLQITSEVIGNMIYQRAILAARENVRSGGTISETLMQFEEFPPLVSSMLAVGERTGRTDYMLENILKFYKAESEAQIRNISQLIEPALILVLGVGVAVLVSSILLPIYSLVSGS